MNLHSHGHRRGVVCAPHAAAVAAGRHILGEGGNALEAMVAMAASCASVYPHMSHLGGDGCLLVREPNGRVRALLGLGSAGETASAALYREHGHDAIPGRGPLAVVTVPGAVAGWALALELARVHGGRLPRDVLMAAAIAQAREGVPISADQARAGAAEDTVLRALPGFAATFLADGKAPAAGAVMRQPKLADTLAHLADAGFDDFYRGDVARELAADLQAMGAPVSRADLARFRAALAEPLRAAVRAGAVFNTPPPTQGVASLILLALFDRLGVTQGESFAHLHGLVEAAKRAMGLRDRILAEPERMARPAADYLDSAFLDGQARRIDPRRAAPWPRAGRDGDTVWMGAADASGLVVSCLQSIFAPFGAGCVSPRTGVLLHNRGCGFSLDPRAPAALAPGRRPPHTLSPALAVLNDGRVMGYGTRGGDAQPQIQALVFSRHVLYRQPLAQALERPRLVLARGGLAVEALMDCGVTDQMRAAGHAVEVAGADNPVPMGQAGAVVMHPSGVLEAAHDPRADGGAEGL